MNELLLPMLLSVFTHAVYFFYVCLESIRRVPNPSIANPKAGTIYELDPRPMGLR